MSNKKLELESRVKFSREWLRSIGAFTGELPQARGKITHVNDFSGITLATIEWDNSEELPIKVNIKNLVHEDDIELV